MTNAAESRPAPTGTSSRRPAPGDTSTCRSGLPEARSATSIVPGIRTSIAKSRSSSSASTPRPDSRIACSTRRATLARVRHPNVVTVHGADVRDGRAGLWMEFVHGRTLESWVQAHGALGPGEATTLGVDLCRALAAVHGAGLVHGDVKAQNVMREDGGRTVLMDFGAGRAQGAQRRRARRHAALPRARGAGRRTRDAAERHLQPRRPAVSPADARVSVFRRGPRRPARGARRRLARDAARPSSGPARRARAARSSARSNRIPRGGSRPPARWSRAWRRRCSPFRLARRRSGSSRHH